MVNLANRIAGTIAQNSITQWFLLIFLSQMQEELPCEFAYWFNLAPHHLSSIIISVFRWKMARVLCVCSWLPCRIYVTSAAQEGGARAFPAARRRQTYVAAKSCGQKSLFIAGERDRGMPYTAPCSISSVLISLTTHLPQYIISLWLQPLGAKWL